MVQYSGTEKARTVSRMFGRIASRYDTGNRVLSMGRDQRWRRQAVKLLDPKPGQRILDLGAGTGDLSLEIAPLVESVVALDISGPMVKLGAQKAGKAGVADKVGFVVSDGLQLPIPDRAFDAVATAFTIRNLASIEDGFAEIFRVLKPGGRMVCLEFTKPRSKLFSAVYLPYLNHILPFLGGRITGDPDAYRYLASSITEFTTAESLAGYLRRAGFLRVSWKTLNMGTVAIHTAQKPRTAKC